MSRTNRPWTAAELTIITTHYPNGLQAAHDALHAAGYTDRTTIATKRQAQRTHLRAAPTNPNDELVLDTLRDYHPCPLTHQDLTEETNIKHETVKAALKRLMREHLVDRRLDPYPNTQYPAFLYYLVENAE